MAQSFFANRSGILATMHRKEKVVAPIVAEQLGICLRVPAQFDTDQFGTFTRDRDRVGDQRQAARLKAERALDLTGETLALASEGTFAPHPGFPVLPCNRELVLLLDRTNSIEIVGEAISLETNFKHQTVCSVEAAIDFAKTVGFPEHGVVVMLNATVKRAEEIIKGIVSEQSLIEAVETLLKRSPTGTVHLETDMRALYNPTRMKVIAQATLDLVKQIQQVCPACGCPGFAVIENRLGLPCGWCGLPTNRTRSRLYHCQKCNFEQEMLFPDGVESADPAQCAYCNP